MSSTIIYPRLGASACVWRQGRVLIVQRGKPPLTGIWSLPGGHVEPGETMRAAAERELLEETGVTARLAHLVDVVDVIQRDEKDRLVAHYGIACFTGKWISGDGSALTEVLAARWVVPEELTDIAMTGGTPEIIRRARDLVTG